MRIRIPGCLGLACLWMLAASLMAVDRPNVLWITSEDNSPYLGCYGDPLARTPNLDALAESGVRYRHAYANAPVCSTARTTLITGMYATSLGVQHHRSNVAIPAAFPLYPEVMRASGYYCTNHSKTDYNVAGRKAIWDESSNRAHYRHRGANQPFFAVFNFTTSHESQVAPKAGKSTFRLEPSQIRLPPYHADTETIRRDWANYYDQMTLLDSQVGELLAELEQAGLSDETIVFYYSDHGGALPRGKRNLHDSGTHVPLIVYFPEKWRHLAPAAPGSWVDDCVSFIDLPPTLLSLCGLAIPANYEGHAFLGPQRVTERQPAFLYRGRMDERYDTVRGVCDGRYRYLRNFAPHRPWGQHYSYPFQVLPSMRSWYEAFQEGRCNAAQARYWKTKPSEEFYVLADDPHEINNRIDDPSLQDVVKRMREEFRQRMIATRDTGFIPEGMFARLAGEKTIYDFAQSDAYAIEPIVGWAERATGALTAADIPNLIRGMRDDDPLVRYWAATGCVRLGTDARDARTALVDLADDPWNDVRVVAAEGLANLEEPKLALSTLESVMSSGNVGEILAAQNTLDAIRLAGRIELADAQRLVRGSGFKEPADRIPRYLLELK